MMRQAWNGRPAIFALLLLPLALAGCGKHGGTGDTFAETIATTFEADCLQAQAGAAKGAQLRRQLCTCTADRIRASGLKASDGDKVNQDKIHTAQQACRQQVYGDKS